MADIAQLDTVFGSNIKPLLAGIAAARAKVTSFQSTSTSAAAKIGSSFVTSGAVVGAALAAMTVAGVREFQQVGGEVRTLEKQLGITAEAASVLRAQGDALGVGVDKLSVGFGIFAKHLVANDSVLGQYGLTMKTTADGSIDFQAMLVQLNGLFGSMPPGLARTAAAMNLFGRSGKTLLPLLAAGSDELAKFAENAKEAGLIMSEDDVQGARELSIAQREMGEAFKGLEVGLARAVIPLLTQLVNIFASFIRTISPALPLIRDIGLAFLAWKAFTFIPTLLLGIATGLEAVGASAAGAGFLNAAIGAEAFVATAGTAAVVAAGFTAALVAGTAALVEWDPLNILPSTEEFNNNLKIGTTEIGNQTVAIGAGRIAMSGLGGETWDTAGAVEELNHHANRTAPVLEHIHRFGGMAAKGLKEFKQAVVESVQVSIGQFKNLNEAFAMTPRQLQNQANAAVRIAQREHRDLAVIFGSKDLSDKQKEALANLPAGMRDAWVRSGKEAREQIANNAVKLNHLNSETFNQITTVAKEKATIGGRGTGLALMTGAIKGIVEGSPAVSIAAAKAVTDAIAAARAAAQAQSPSRLMALLGGDMIAGLIVGMAKMTSPLQRSAERVVDILTDAVSDAKDKLRDAIEKGVGETAARATVDLRRLELEHARHWEKMANDAIKAFNKIKDRYKDFVSDIRSGFEQFGDFAGTITGLFGQTDEAGNAIAVTSGDISSAIQSQVAEAQRLASDIQQAAALGLSKALVAQFAQAGSTGADALEQLIQNPALIAEMNEAAKIINTAAGDTAEALGAKFFGKAIRNATDDLKFAAEALKGFTKGLIQALGALGAAKQLQNLMQSLMQGLGGGGGGGGNSVADTVAQFGGGSHMPNVPKPPHWEPTWHPPKPGGGGGGGGNNITVHVNGWVGSDQDIAKKVRDELVRVGRNNGGNGL